MDHRSRHAHLGSCYSDAWFVDTDGDVHRPVFRACRCRGLGHVAAHCGSGAGSTERSLTGLLAPSRKVRTRSRQKIGGDTDGCAGTHAGRLARRGIDLLSAHWWSRFRRRNLEFFCARQEGPKRTCIDRSSDRSHLGSQPRMADYRGHYPVYGVPCRICPDYDSPAHSTHAHAAGNRASRHGLCGADS